MRSRLLYKEIDNNIFIPRSMQAQMIRTGTRAGNYFTISKTEVLVKKDDW